MDTTRLDDVVNESRISGGAAGDNLMVFSRLWLAPSQQTYLGFLILPLLPATPEPEFFNISQTLPYFQQYFQQSGPSLSASETVRSQLFAKKLPNHSILSLLFARRKIAVAGQDLLPFA